MSKCKWANLESFINLNHGIYSIEIHKIYFYYQTNSLNCFVTLKIISKKELNGNKENNIYE